MNRITSRSNAHYKSWIHLLRSRERKKSGLFLIEGFRELSRALKAKINLIEVILSETASAHSTTAGWLGTLPEKLTSYILPDDLFQTLSVREHPDGFLGVAQLKISTVDTWVPKLNGLYLLVERLEKPGNLGALMRSAEATAVDAVLVADPCVDLFNPHVIRASQGAVFQVPAYCQSTDELLTRLHATPLALWAATPHAQRTYWDCDFTQGSVICIGNEASGLQPIWFERATPMLIPMYGQSADSLNASVAGTLCLYEAQRQRHLRH